MALTKQLQQDWEETAKFENEISERMFDPHVSEGEIELLVGMLCMCQMYRETLQSRVTM